ncbi:MAG: aminodeoxychorismate/anthranilate synthase component II [Spirochaetia bacterium]|nr:aminodeoxychorismate/anthranilate synthase component II [Spirochaetia bacterium]
MKVLIIDNYDSFTYNLYQYVGEILELNFPNSRLDVVRNNEITVDEIEKRNYNKIIISPGPGSPDDINYFGVCSDVIKLLGKKIPLLGVCLGMQGIAHCFGGIVKKARVPMHGKTSLIDHDEKGIFTGLPQNLEVMRYHSLIVASESIPDDLVITSRSKFIDQEGYEIMGLRHKQYPIEGIQFHPESFATEGGKKMLENFILGN